MGKRGSLETISTHFDLGGRALNLSSQSGLGKSDRCGRISRHLLLRQLVFSPPRLDRHDRSRLISRFAWERAEHRKTDYRPSRGGRTYRLAVHVLPIILAQPPFFHFPYGLRSRMVQDRGDPPRRGARVGGALPFNSPAVRSAARRRVRKHPSLGSKSR